MAVPTMIATSGPAAPRPTPGPTGLSPAGQTHRRDLQPGLRLLLFLDKEVLPRQHLPHGRAGAGAIHPPAYRVTPDGKRQHRLAGAASRR